jgi:hypothetical protein
VADWARASETTGDDEDSPATFVLKLYFENNKIMSRQLIRIAASAIPNIAT